MYSLPNEILLQIFENLTYEDLKFTIPMTSKRLSSLVSNTVTAVPYGRIAQLLFRDSLPGRRSHRPPPAVYTINPAFKHISFKGNVVCADILTNPTDNDDGDGKTIFVEFDLEEFRRDQGTAQMTAGAKIYTQTYLFDKRFFSQNDERKDMREENCVSPASDNVFILLEGLFGEYFDCHNPNSVAARENNPCSVFSLVAIILYLVVEHAVWKIGVDGLVQAPDTATTAPTMVTPEGAGNVSAAPVESGARHSGEGCYSVIKPKRRAVYAYLWPGVIDVENAKDRINLVTKITCLGLRT